MPDVHVTIRDILLQAKMGNYSNLYYQLMEIEKLYDEMAGEASDLRRTLEGLGYQNCPDCGSFEGTHKGLPECEEDPELLYMDCCGIVIEEAADAPCECAKPQYD